MSEPYFEADGVRIFHGDCAEVAPDLETVGLMVTDPPYALGSQRSEWSATAGVAIGLREAAKRVDRKGAALVMTTSSGRGIEFTMGAMGKRLPFNRVLAWNKTFVNSAVAGPWRWNLVLVLAFGRATFGRPFASSVFTNAGYASTKVRGTGHPAELDPDMGEWMLKPWEGSGVTVFDPFMGSGSILIAARRLGLSVVGVEVEEKYCEIAAKRLSTAHEPPIDIQHVMGGLGV